MDYTCAKYIGNKAEKLGGEGGVKNEIGFQRNSRVSGYREGGLLELTKSSLAELARAMSALKIRWGGSVTCR
ncbi:hypothetical protein VTG60DRAFT_1261 [Thermothelomyces hinnuleus]